MLFTEKILKRKTHEQILLCTSNTTINTCLATTIHLPRNYYTFTLQKVYSCNAKGTQLQPKRYTVAMQKVYSCNREAMRLQHDRFSKGPAMTLNAWKATNNHSSFEN